jgi:hypothetical protein
MKYAWIEGQKIRDVAPGNPNEIYHPDVAVLYDTQVPDNAVNGDGWVGGQLAKPEPALPAPPTPPVARTWTQDDVRAGLTLSEKVKWDNNSVPEILTVKSELSSPQELALTTELLQLLVDVTAISQASMDKVLL